MLAPFDYVCVNCSHYIINDGYTLHTDKSYTCESRSLSISPQNAVYNIVSRVYHMQVFPFFPPH